MELVLKGRLKNLVVNEDGIHIQYAKAMMKGEKTIPFSQVVSVQVKKPGLMNGYIYFQTVGATGTKATIQDISTDDNSIVFSGKDKYQAALEIKTYVEHAQRNNAVSHAPQSTASAADEILKLKNLLDMGAITQEEFETKKRQLLEL
ncbi:SHOCT domain-containing protein [Anaeromassilibacillus senegalensis]|uniref:SHOCT domain-containing protein n=1 Tax=Anaeromassilibacillus senegalensis TaxID=1673717 RepID=UPI00068003C1|nr:SHOCT domain-containing protein [Anaeromassilibacillus senegalensis]